MDNSQTNFVRLTSTPMERGQDVAHERMAATFIVKQPGYVYIYLSNDETTPLEVFFDDFTVTHAKGPVVQSQDYYPFGLTFNLYNRENSASQDYKYNGKEIKNDLELGVLDYGARLYSPDVARFGVIDPMFDKSYAASPYSYVKNNPIFYVDYQGKFPVPVIYLIYEGFAFAFAATGAMYVVTNHDKLVPGIFVGDESFVLQARGKSRDPYWAPYVFRDNRSVQLDVGQPMGNDPEPAPKPGKNKNFNRAALGFLSLAVLANYQEYKRFILQGKKELKSVDKRINNRIDEIYKQTDKMFDDNNLNEEYFRLIEEKQILQDLREENNQRLQALQEAEDTIDYLYNQGIQKQDATRRTDKYYSQEFLDWYYRKSSKE